MNDLLHTLWFDRPAEKWMSEALPLGNGRLGAMVFGGAPLERVAFNENTLWSGDPAPVDRAEAAGALGRVRALLFSGKAKEAERLAEETMTVSGDGFGCFQAFGDLWIDGLPEAEDAYRRSLDLRTAVASTSYRCGAGWHRREVFVSHPDQVLAIRIENPEPMSLRMWFTTLHPDARIRSGPDGLVLRGTNGRLIFEARAVLETNGEIGTDGSSVFGAKAITVYLAAATNYRPEPPEFCSPDITTDLAGILMQARRAGWESLRERQIAAHSRLSGRTEMTLESDAQDDLPTDVRLRRTPDDPALAALVFHYGRYLLLASSRAGGLPANLQGLWADSLMPPWNCDFHLNINLQMNYWPAEVAGLGECAVPLLDYIDFLRPAGRRTAALHYGCGGWVVHWASNVWARTVPGWSATWGIFHVAGAWLALHAWEHYCFSPDKRFLIGRLLPLLRETCAFYFDFLVRDPATGFWCTAPSVSPENAYFQNGEVVFLSRAPAMDIQILRELFGAGIQAARLAGDGEFEEKCRDYLKDLPPDRVGTDGRLLEWEAEFPEVDPLHRHISHLFGLYPGSSITPDETPALAEAARRSLEARGDDGTGWSKAWKICFWARLRDGERSAKLLTEMLTCIEETAEINYAHGGVYSNLLCAHPPFQIDGNLGATAAIAEMLLQSHRREIHVLPALPSAWPNGSFRGLRARGGFAVSAVWKDLALQELEVKSECGGPCRIRLPAGFVASAPLAAESEDIFVWSSRPGETLEVSIPRVEAELAGVG